MSIHTCPSNRCPLCNPPTWVEFGRKAGDTDAEWAAACKDMARALAKATGMEHLLPTDKGEA